MMNSFAQKSKALGGHTLDKDDNGDLWLPSDMNWAKPQYRIGEVDKAGARLTALLGDPNGVAELPQTQEELDGLYAIVNNWRAIHSYPLITMRVTLTNRAASIDASSTVVQRIKRISSITRKLDHNANMKLSQMQDIGGCRAILKNVQRVVSLVSLYKEKSAEEPDKGQEFYREYNYIDNPKPTGYRGVHLIYKYRTKTEALKIYNGRRIELQIRSVLQHAWATAVEIVGTFRHQALKSAQGDDDWLRFFALMGSAIAIRERSTSFVPGTPDTAEALKAELKDYVQRLGVNDYLDGCSSAIRILKESPSILRQSDYFLIELDPVLRQTSLTGYSRDSLDQASKDSLALERTKKHSDVVLVSAKSLNDIEKGYPNYFIDTHRFVNAMLRATQ